MLDALKSLVVSHPYAAALVVAVVVLSVAVVFLVRSARHRGVALRGATEALRAALQRAEAAERALAVPVPVPHEATERAAAAALAPHMAEVMERVRAQRQDMASDTAHLEWLGQHLDQLEKFVEGARAVRQAYADAKKIKMVPATADPMLAPAEGAQPSPLPAA